MDGLSLATLRIPKPYDETVNQLRGIVQRYLQLTGHDTPDVAAQQLRQMVSSIIDLREWACPNRKTRVLKLLLGPIRTIRIELETQLHNHMWPWCDADGSTENPRHSSPGAPTVNLVCSKHGAELQTCADLWVMPEELTAQGAERRINQLVATFQGGGIHGLEQAKQLLGELQMCREWATVDENDVKGLLELASLGQQCADKLGRQIHKWKFPACKRWPACEHQHEFLPPEAFSTVNTNVDTVVPCEPLIELSITPTTATTPPKNHAAGAPPKKVCCQFIRGSCASKFCHFRHDDIRISELKQHGCSVGLACPHHPTVGKEGWKF